MIDSSYFINTEFTESTAYIGEALNYELIFKEAVL